ncbi:MAG: hypothetical protein ACTJHU_05225 [Mycetocola sp.]
MCVSFPELINPTITVGGFFAHRSEDAYVRDNENQDDRTDEAMEEGLTC